MTTPTITISVSGVPVAATSTAIPSTPVAGMATATTAEVSTKNLYMTYVQAVKGDKREQFIVFPPGVESLGVTDKWTGNGQRLKTLHRKQDFPGNRSKWFEKYLYTAYDQTIQGDLDNLSNRGYEIGGLVVVPLEVDDYVKVYNGTTPHKALRAIDRALQTIGLSIK